MSKLASVARVFERVAEGGRVAVAVSGGKDSIVTLDLAVRILGPERVLGFKMFLVADLECEERPLRRIESRFGVRVVRIPHWWKSHLVRNGIMMPRAPGAEAIKELRQPDVERYVRKHLDVGWTVWGMRAADSIVRNAYLKRIKGVDEKALRLYPIWAWKKADVYGYLKARNLPTPEILGGDHLASGGVTLRPESLLWLKKSYPDDYRKVIAEFPFAEAGVFRAERMGILPATKAARDYQQANPGVRRAREDQGA